MPSSIPYLNVSIVCFCICADLSSSVIGLVEYDSLTSLLPLSVVTYLLRPFCLRVNGNANKAANENRASVKYAADATPLSSSIEASLFAKYFNLDVSSSQMCVPNTTCGLAEVGRRSLLFDTTLLMIECCEPHIIATILSKITVLMGIPSTEMTAAAAGGGD